MVTQPVSCDVIVQYLDDIAWDRDLTTGCGPFRWAECHRLVGEVHGLPIHCYDTPQEIDSVCSETESFALPHSSGRAEVDESLELGIDAGVKGNHLLNGQGDHLLLRDLWKLRPVTGICRQTPVPDGRLEARGDDSVDHGNRAWL